MERKKIEREDILKAIERMRLVIVKNPGKPNFPYQGRILKEKKNDEFWFKGFSKSEEMEGNIRAGDIIAIDKVCGKFCTICCITYPVETRVCPYCEKSAWIMISKRNEH